MPRDTAIPCGDCGQKFGGDTTWRRHRRHAGDVQRCKTPRELTAMRWSQDPDSVWHRPPTQKKTEQLALIDRRGVRVVRTVRQTQRTRRRELINQAGGKCIDCGFVGSEEQYDFHHRDPYSKLFTLSGGSMWRLDVDEEMAKCDLLCANCHRSRHAYQPTWDQIHGQNPPAAPLADVETQAGVGGLDA